MIFKDGWQAQGLNTVMNNTPKQVDGEPTIYPNIVFRHGEYVPTGPDPYFDSSMMGRLEWMSATDGGKNIQPGDNCLFAREVIKLGLPTKHDATVTSVSDKLVGSRPELARFAWLGDPCNMKHIGPLDTHRCSSCNLSVSGFVPGETFLNQHAYFTKGKCPYLTANYTTDRLKIEIGQARFRRDFVAHPDVITAPDAWNHSTVQLTNGIYVTLAAQQWCYMCGSLPAEHGPNCHRKMLQLIHMLKNGLSELKL